MKHFIIPLAVIIFCLLLSILSYRSKNKTLNIIAWVVACISFGACSILRRTPLDIYATTLLAGSFIALISRAEKRTEGWHSIVWKALLTIALLTISCIISAESFERISYYVVDMFLSHHHDVSWITDMSRYVFPAFLLSLSLLLGSPLLDRVKKLMSGRTLLLAIIVSVTVISGTFICFVSYSSIGPQCFPLSLSSFLPFEDLLEYMIILVGLLLHGLAVYVLNSVFAKQKQKSNAS